MNDSIIYKYLSGQATEREIAQLKEWLEESHEHRTEYFDLRALWHARRMAEIGNEKRIEDSLNQLNIRIDGLSAGKKRIHFAYWLKYAGIAVAVVVGVLFSFFYYLDEDSVSPSDEYLLTFTNESSDYSVKSVYLADGSVVWLRANARLTAPSAFDGEKRRVTLEGEAFFEVQKDPDHPFIVQTEQYEVQVLGTSFNINTRQENGASETTLASGAVRLQTRHGEQLAVLQPGQQALYIQEGQEVTIREVDVNALTSWRFGLISLSDVTINEILCCLENTYDTKIHMDVSSLSDRRFNFSFKRSKGLKAALEQLRFITGESAKIIP